MSASLNGRSTLSAPHYPCWIEVDLDAVGENVRALRALVGPRTRLLAVVKAEAYGLGAVAVARAALAAGADCLAVARVAEGVQLRRAGVRAPILNLAYTGVTELRTLVEHEITPTVVDVESARALASIVGHEAHYPIHVKVDTGLSRFGAQPIELKQLLDTLSCQGNLRIEGFYSHLATADESGKSFALEQLVRYSAALHTLEECGLKPGLRHLANSAATLTLPETRLDMVRVGITLSGHFPTADMTHPVSLRPAATLKAVLARVYRVKAGATVGYNRTFRTDRPLRIGLVPVGYADGLPRAHSNRAAVLIRGKRAALIGRVSMDQCVVDLSAVPDAEPGDEVVLIGRQADEEISLHEFAAWDNTIVHEAICRIGVRVPRVYRVGGHVREIEWLGGGSTATPLSALRSLPTATANGWRSPGTGSDEPRQSSRLGQRAVPPD